MVRQSGQSTVPNQRLRQQREARGWSQKYVALQVKTSDFTVGRWERGTSFPSAYFRTKLCDLFELPDEDLGFAVGTTSAGPLQRFVARQEDALKQSLPPIYDPAIPPLPTQMHELVGRDDLLHRLKMHLLTHRSLALSALHGLPGVGKTALANQLAHDSEVQAHFHHGILWAGIGQHPNLVSLLSTWGALLTIAPSEITTLTSTAEWANTLRDVIGERHMLIVLDDVWHIDNAFALKIGGPHCTYLLTTRFPQVAVQFAAEHATVVYELNEDDSLILLARFAPRVVAHDLEAARALVHAAGGLPLALTIMGRYLQLHAHSDQPRRIKAALERLQDIKERLCLAHSTNTVERPPSLATGTSFSLQAVIALSEQQLAQEARQALRALALFAPKPNTFSEEAALAVAHVSTKTLDVLEDAGLLEVSNPNRYTLHQTITDYAHLDTPDVLAEQRLVLFNMNYIEAHQREYGLLEQEATNIFTALHLASKHNMQKPFIQGILALAPFWEARGLYDLAEIYLNRALGDIVGTDAARPRRQRTGPKDASHRSLQITKARLYLALGRIAERRGMLEAAEQHYETGMTLARLYDNQEIMSSLLANRGETAINRGDFKAAIRFAEEGLTLARAIGDQWRITLLLKILGEAVDCFGEFERGDQLYLEGLELARKIGDWEMLCTLLQNLGAKAVKRGDYTLAAHYVQEGLEKAREMEHRQRLSALLMIMGVIAVRHEGYEQARAYYQESLHLARMIGHRVRLSNVLQNLGMLEGSLENHALSNVYFQESLAIARAVGHRWLIGETLDEWGEVCIARKDWSKAKTLFSEALELTQAIGTQELIAHALFGMGRIDAHEGNYAEAWRKGRQALAFFEAEHHERMNDVLHWLNTLPKK
ncbi:MAG: hypothetical protein NVS4B11_18030 [Ktedonobacteraceae bacterium]